MKRKLFIFICCSLCIALTSCTKYLDVKPKGKVIPKTAEEFSSILHYWLDDIEKGTDDYTSFITDLENSVRKWTKMIMELKSDDAEFQSNSSNYKCPICCRALLVSTEIKNTIQHYIPLSKIAT